MTTMTDMEPLHALIECLRNYDVAINHDELQAALQGEHSPAIRHWIDEHLRPDSLLTRDEFAQYEELESSGQTDSLASSPDILRIRGVGDLKLQGAIEELQRSTVAIEKQTELLRMQQDALVTLVKTNRQHSETRAIAGEGQHRMWTSEATHIDFAIDELIRGLAFRIAELEDTGRTAETSLRKTASEVLRVDDRLLSNLQKLTNDIVSGKTEDDDAARRVRELCARLIKYTVEGARTHLDRVYLEAVASEGDSMYTHGNRDAVEVAALQEELESLYTEILPVAQMSAEQQYLEPVIRLTATRIAQDRDRSTRAITFISKCLSVLVDRLLNLTIRIKEYQSYRATAHLLINHAKTELESNPPMPPIAFKPSSQSHARKLNKPVSPVRSRNTRRRSSVASLEDDTNAEQQLLRNLGISVPAELPADDSTAANLKNILLDRTTKLNNHARNLQQSSETSIACHIRDAQLTFHLLRQSLLSEAEFNSRRLLDPEILEAIANSELEVEGVKLETSKVDLERLRERNTRKEELVQRWR